ncbi:DUF2285 domain-containing protein [Mesorhizobium sp. PAMC28654]|nr:DUF2285 domain-containing protein [Mesorhizobium sp. PAMC28654]
MLDPDVADEAPTGYDEERLFPYICLPDAAAENADWCEVAHIVSHIDPEKEPVLAYRAWERHLARARWMTTNGYRFLVAAHPTTGTPTGGSTGPPHTQNR